MEKKMTYTVIHSREGRSVRGVRSGLAMQRRYTTRIAVMHNRNVLPRLFVREEPRRANGMHHHPLVPCVCLSSSRLVRTFKLHGLPVPPLRF